MSFIIIIPALEKNRYSTKGDLVSWGASTLLEWKISQAKKIIGAKEICVVATGKKIKQVCKEQNVSFLKRENKLKDINKLHLFVAKKFQNDFIVWLNPTYPFIKPKTASKFIKIFKKNSKNFDSLVSSFNLKEFLFLKNKSINFDYLKKSISRSEVKKVNLVVNAITIIKGSTVLKYKNLFGKRVQFNTIDWLSSLEIKNSKDINLFEKLIETYFNYSK